MHPCELADEYLLQQCDERRQRRSGPGGQHRNKVETAIVLTHRKSGVQAEATERRSQHENRRVALRRLRLNLALQVRCERPAAAVPSQRWAARCQKQRLSISPSHPDLAPLLAEALDVAASTQYDLAAAARQLGVTTSQLVRFLKLEPRALQDVNQQRQQRGQRPLR
jgi:hypothetical protein